MKLPSGPLVAVELTPVPSSVTLTIAPGMRAPAVSITVPMIAPVSTCAGAGVPKTSTTRRSTKERRRTMGIGHTWNHDLAAFFDWITRRQPYIPVAAQCQEVMRIRIESPRRIARSVDSINV